MAHGCLATPRTGASRGARSGPGRAVLMGRDRDDGGEGGRTRSTKNSIYCMELATLQQLLSTPRYSTTFRISVFLWLAPASLALHFDIAISCVPI